MDISRPVWTVLEAKLSPVMEECTFSIADYDLLVRFQECELKVLKLELGPVMEECEFSIADSESSSVQVSE